MSGSTAADLERAARRTLWISVIGTPLLFLFALGVNYAFVTRTCDTGSGLWHLLISLPAILLAALSIRTALRTWRAAGADLHLDQDTVVHRARFISGLGLMISALMLLMLIAQAIPILVLSPCVAT